MLSHMKATQKTLSLLTKPKSLKQLKQIQCQLTVTATLTDSYAAAKLISSYIAQNQISHAQNLFLHIPHKSTFIWNTMIQTYAQQHTNPTKALSLYTQMLKCGISPNNFTFSFVLKACVFLKNVQMGVVFHAQVVKLGWESYDFVQNGLVHLYVSCGGVESARKMFEVSKDKDVVTWTALVNGYFKCGEVEVARELFDRMPEKNDVSWSAMINGYVQVGLYRDALEVFYDMLGAGFWPNHAGIVGAVNACGFLGALERGRRLHGYVYKFGIELDNVLGTSIIDMYAKCGCIDAACSVFERMRARDVFAYTSMISGLANHDRSACAIGLFDRMKNEGVLPNEVTFICVLSACTRMGLVKEGLRTFESMSRVYGVKPGVQHYGCLVDLLGRAGLLEEAKNVVADMPNPDCYALGALLDACRVHGDVKLGEETLNNLVQQSLHSDGKYVLLSNMYASVYEWNNVARVRKEMEDIKVKKMPGSSSIEINGMVYDFVAGDRSYVAMGDIDFLLFRMDKHLKSSWSDNDDIYQMNLKNK